MLEYIIEPEKLLAQQIAASAPAAAAASFSYF